MPLTMCVAPISLVLLLGEDRTHLAISTSVAYSKLPSAAALGGGVRGVCVGQQRSQQGHTVWTWPGTIRVSTPRFQTFSHATPMLMLMQDKTGSQHVLMAGLAHDVCSTRSKLTHNVCSARCSAACSSLCVAAGPSPSDPEQSSPRTAILCAPPSSGIIDLEYGSRYSTCPSGGTSAALATRRLLYHTSSAAEMRATRQ